MQTHVLSFQGLKFILCVLNGMTTKTYLNIDVFIQYKFMVRHCTKICCYNNIILFLLVVKCQASDLKSETI